MTDRISKTIKSQIWKWSLLYCPMPVILYGSFICTQPSQCTSYHTSTAALPFSPPFHVSSVELHCVNVLQLCPVSHLDVGMLAFRCHYSILNQLPILISIKKPPDIYWYIPSLVFCWECIDPRIFQMARGSEDTVMCFYKGKSVFSSCLSKAATVIEI